MEQRQTRVRPPWEVTFTTGLGTPDLQIQALASDDGPVQLSCAIESGGETVALHSIDGQPGRANVTCRAPIAR